MNDRVHHQRDQLVRRYTPGGKVAHLIPDTDWQHPVPHALCGWNGQQTYWLGSGSQDEYDRAELLPTCRSCDMWVRRTSLDIGKAITIAARVHAGQLDKAGKPYIKHPADVAARIRRADRHDEVGEVVAWLHDVLEDGHNPAELEGTIRALFGGDIADAVVAITYLPELEPRDIYYARVKANPIALRVKLADIASNTDPKRTALLDPATRDRLARKYAHALEVLS